MKENKLDQITGDTRATDLDPEGIEIGLGMDEMPESSPATSSSTGPQINLERMIDQDAAPYGTPAVLCAGFRPEEVAQVRALLDMAGGQEIKVVPCNDRELRLSVSKALLVPEPDWEKPKPEEVDEDGVVTSR